MRNLLKIGCVLTALLLVAGIGAAGALPMYLDFSVGRELEVTSIIQQLRELEENHRSWDGAYQEVPTPFPRPLHAADDQPSEYLWDNQDLSTLGFYPEDEDMYGVYWIEVESADFTVHGLIEVDGELQHYTATHQTKVTRQW